MLRNYCYMTLSQIKKKSKNLSKKIVCLHNKNPTNKTLACFADEWKFLQFLIISLVDRNTRENLPISMLMDFPESYSIPRILIRL